MYEQQYANFWYLTGSENEIYEIQISIHLE